MPAKPIFHGLMKIFDPIVFTEGETLDGTYFRTVVNVNRWHIRIINQLGLAEGTYCMLSEVQLE